MNQLSKVFLSIVFILSSLNISFAQDRLYTVSDTAYVEVKVIEVNPTDIKYKKYSNIDGPTYSISIEDVTKIVYQNGEIEEYGSIDKRNTEKQQSTELMPTSKLYLSFASTPGKESVNGKDAIGMLLSYIEGKTNCPVVSSIDEADFTLELQVVKSFMGDRRAKISLKHLATGSVVYETKWARGTSNAFYGYSGTRHAIGILVKNHIVEKYPAISNGG